MDSHAVRCEWYVAPSAEHTGVPSTIYTRKDREVIAKIANGFTLINAEGGWSDGHHYYDEPTTILVVFVSGDTSQVYRRTMAISCVVNRVARKEGQQSYGQAMDNVFKVIDVR